MKLIIRQIRNNNPCVHEMKTALHVDFEVYQGLFEGLDLRSHHSTLEDTWNGTERFSLIEDFD